MMLDEHVGSVRERIDRSCDLLSSSYRRHVIYALQADGPASVGELADAVVSAGIADEHERAMASLVHNHLPKLAEFDVVTYDGPNDEVSLDDGIAGLEPFLTTAARAETESEPRAFAEVASPDSIARNAPD
ncbi:DUF7344 domain-containing protein [Halorussus lipolyticus]|uniref:DUF7344 domain-containing protein n=1 Tax=Halorussus lipolyticus TaxID=3034024 RepID=UPI0023E75E42|nr:hypothetical protein [Halorussus sp. DT80]